MNTLDDKERFEFARFLDFLRDEPPAFSEGTTDRLRLQVEWLAWALRSGEVSVPSEIVRYPADASGNVFRTQSSTTCEASP